MAMEGVDCVCQLWYLLCGSSVGGIGRREEEKKQVWMISGGRRVTTTENAMFVWLNHNRFKSIWKTLIDFSELGYGSHVVYQVVLFR